MSESEQAQSVIGGVAPQLPVVLPLLESRRETPRMVTLFFPLPDRPAPCFDVRATRPGQFFSMWLPGVDEKPFVASFLERDRFGVTVLARGPFTRRVQELSPGALLGFRGPYGRGFWGWEELGDGAGAALVGGGCGMAPLALLAERLPAATIVQGAPTAGELLYTERFARQVLYTDDGTRGHCGLPTEWLTEALGRGELRAVYTCGPEAMMAAVVGMCREAGVPCQAALERYMKCGFGICGQCECDGRLVCQDGPVFSADELSHMPSFGHHKRDATGRKVPLTPDECAAPPAVDSQ